MLLLLVLLAAASSCAKATSDDDRLVLSSSPNTQSFASSPAATWQATNSNRFATWTVGEAKKLLGVKSHVIPATVPRSPSSKSSSFPKAKLAGSFDSRTRWPTCINPIRDQQRCGSCWAFGAAEALSDRFCIQSNASVKVVLSPQDLVSCNTAGGNMGCGGGYPYQAWYFMQANGIVADSCYPYISGNGITGDCKNFAGTKQCSVSGGTGKVVRYYSSSLYAIPALDVAAMQNEIMTNGPIEVSFAVYEDFFSYSSGVYSHRYGKIAGGHAVKVIGWGTLGGVDYWTVANSWGAAWGMNGYFLIKRGVNECQIESAPIAGLAKV